MLQRYQLHPEQDIPIYQQIVDMILAQIKSDALSPDTQLPTVRDLAEQLDVARGTAKRAYDELERYGAIRKEQGRGTFVCYQPASSDSRKDRAMAAIDQMLDILEEMDFSPAEINIFLDLKLRQRAAARDELKIAVVECNPETLSQLADQLHRTVGPVDLYPHLLSDVTAYPYRIGEDMDLIVISAEHADVLKDVISQKDKIARIALRLMPQSVAQILRLAPGSEVGILCRSSRFGQLIHAVCADYADGAVIRPPLLMDGASRVEEYLSGLSALVVPDGFEKYCPAPVLQHVRALDAERRLIRCLYQVDEGSMMYLTERIEHLRDKKRM
ncbi:MAG: GntR family transcriptional regulator [Oscillospiraceae bacterium]|nr:GntR family transcriptional regulator [Oscillospiraceae bacterium]